MKDLERQSIEHLTKLLKEEILNTINYFRINKLETEQEAYLRSKSLEKLSSAFYNMAMWKNDRTYIENATVE